MIWKSVQPPDLYVTSHIQDARPGISNRLRPTSKEASRTTLRPGVTRCRWFPWEWGFHAIKAGRYLISASLEKESGYGIGLFDRNVDLAEGNQSVLVEFNARNFYGRDDGTRFFLRDLVVTGDDEVIDEIPEAWSSGEMNFGG